MRKTLPEICELQYGYPFDSSLFCESEGTPVIRIRDVVRGFSETKTTETCSEDYLVQNGDILIGMDGEFNIAKWKGGAAFLNQRVCKLIPFDVDSDYIFFAMPKILKEIEAKTSFATVKHLSAKQLKSIVIELPPKDVQKYISNIFNKINTLIESRTAQLSKLDQLVKARFVEMFGDPMINSLGLPIVRLSSALAVDPQNGLYKPQTDYVDDNSGTPILRIDSFYNGKLCNIEKLKRLICTEQEKQKYLLNDNDIVINRVNSLEYLGKCGHIKNLNEDTVFESNMMRFHMDENKFDAVYLTTLLSSKFIYRQILNRAKKAVNQASINQEDVRSFEIYMPPLEKQKEFAASVQKVDKTKTAVKQSLEKLETLKKSLMQEYFG